MKPIRTLVAMVSCGERKPKVIQTDKNYDYQIAHSHMMMECTVSLLLQRAQLDCNRKNDGLNVFCGFFFALR